ncbi:hypothetical protein HK104_000770 [Borealophlyctis nickersoniae]|nr:hypothetical protein HK104_000770 [Borealophlyctis nickersoniae]
MSDYGGSGGGGWRNSFSGVEGDWRSRDRDGPPGLGGPSVRRSSWDASASSTLSAAAGWGMNNAAGYGGTGYGGVYGSTSWGGGVGSGGYGSGSGGYGGGYGGGGGGYGGHDRRDRYTGGYGGSSSGSGWGTGGASDAWGTKSRGWTGERSSYGGNFSYGYEPPEKPSYRETSYSASSRASVQKWDTIGYSRRMSIEDSGDTWGTEIPGWEGDGCLWDREDCVMASTAFADPDSNTFFEGPAWDAGQDWHGWDGQGANWDTECDEWDECVIPGAEEEESWHETLPGWNGEGSSWDNDPYISTMVAPAVERDAGQEPWYGNVVISAAAEGPQRNRWNDEPELQKAGPMTKREPLAPWYPTTGEPKRVSELILGWGEPGAKDPRAAGWNDVGVNMVVNAGWDQWDQKGKSTFDGQDEHGRDGGEDSYRSDTYGGPDGSMDRRSSRDRADRPVRGDRQLYVPPARAGVDRRGSLDSASLGRSSSDSLPFAGGPRRSSFDPGSSWGADPYGSSSYGGAPAFGAPPRSDAFRAPIPPPPHPPAVSRGRGPSRYQTSRESITPPNGWDDGNSLSSSKGPVPAAFWDSRGEGSQEFEDYHDSSGSVHYWGPIHHCKPPEEFDYDETQPEPEPKAGIDGDWKKAREEVFKNETGWGEPIQVKPWGESPFVEDIGHVVMGWGDEAPPPEKGEESDKWETKLSAAQGWKDDSGSGEQSRREEPRYNAAEAPAPTSSWRDEEIKVKRWDDEPDSSTHSQQGDSSSPVDNEPATVGYRGRGDDGYYHPRESVNKERAVRKAKSHAEFRESPRETREDVANGSRAPPARAEPARDADRRKPRNPLNASARLLKMALPTETTAPAPAKTSAAKEKASTEIKHAWETDKDVRPVNKAPQVDEDGFKIVGRGRRGSHSVHAPAPAPAATSTTKPSKSTPAPAPVSTAKPAKPAPKPVPAAEESGHMVAVELTVDPVTNRVVMHRKDRVVSGGGRERERERGAPASTSHQQQQQPVEDVRSNGRRKSAPASAVPADQRRPPPKTPSQSELAVEKPPRAPPIVDYHTTPTKGGRGRNGGETRNPPAGRTPATPATPKTTSFGGRVWVDSDKTDRSAASPRTPGNGRLPVYDEYISLREVADGLKRSTLLQGHLRINKRNRFDAYVAIENQETDVFISGLKHRNRAFEGDLVVVQLLQGAELEEQRGKQKDRKDRIRRENKERQKKCDMDEVEEEEVEEEREEDEEESAEDRVFGRVVYILERKAQQSYAGTLMMDSPAGGRRDTPTKTRRGRDAPKIVWFKPTDKRVPLLAIPIEHAPKDWLAKPQAFENVLYRAMVRKWQATSNHPFGVVTGVIGQMGEIPIETDALLCDAGIDWDEFSEDVDECLPATPWTIPKEEIAARRDLRQERIFSIDPPTAKDLDDAVSVKPLDDGTFEVGVHIADVSYFVKPDTALDKEALHRATTVYLVQRAIPMLPPLLCEELCSLNPGVDRLAFSVIWKFDDQARVLGKPWFGRTVIRSCAKLSYDHAQAIIEDRVWNDGQDLPEVKLDGGFTEDEIEDDVMRLYEFSVKMRERRFANGALAIHSVKLWFAMDSSENPMDCGVYNIRESNKLIEEFMLLANMAVAKKISTYFPDNALLRRHSPPIQRAMKDFVAFAAKLGYEIDPTDSSSLQASFEAIEDEQTRQVLKLLCIKPMQRAKYFCTGSVDIEHWHHYALNVPLYTHFTSPIRRYCDLVVHRLLDKAIRNDTNRDGFDKTTIAFMAKQCNNRKEASKAAQDASQKLYLCAYLHLLAENMADKAIVEDALVYNVGSRSMDVMVPRFGIEKRVWVEDLVELGAVVGSEFDEEKLKMKIYWNKERYGGGAADVDDVADGMAKLAVTNGDDGDDNDADADAEDVTAQMDSLAITDASSSSSTVTPTPKKTRKRAYDPSTVHIQTVGMFESVKVRIIPDVKKSPPDFRVFVAYPGDKVQKKAEVAGAHGEAAVVSCPGIAEEVY